MSSYFCAICTKIIRKFYPHFSIKLIIKVITSLEIYENIAILMMPATIILEELKNESQTFRLV